MENKIAQRKIRVKLPIILVIVFLLINSFLIPLVQAEENDACTPKEYVIELMDDVGEEPNSVAHFTYVQEIITEQPPGRTGYSINLYRYDNTLPPRIMDDGSMTYWQLIDTWSTMDAHPSARHNPADHRQAIVDKYGEEVYNKAIEQGVMMIPIYGDNYIDYPGKNIYSYHSFHDIPNPKNGDEAFSYYNNKVEVKFTLEGECDEEQTPGEGGESGGSCEMSISVTTSGEMKSNPEDMEADPIGLITEEDGQSGIFDVLTYGIPTDEYLHLRGETERYLSSFQFQQYTGQIKYTIKVDKTYNRNWTVSNWISKTCYDSKGQPYDCSYNSPLPKSDSEKKLRNQR